MPNSVIGGRNLHLQPEVRIHSSFWPAGTEDREVPQRCRLPDPEEHLPVTRAPQGHHILVW